MDFIRYRMYEDIRSTLTREGALPLKGSILGISGIGHFQQFIDPTANVTETKWPDVTILDLPYPEETFDIVITDQILEHVEGSCEHAVRESMRVLKKGGIAIHTSVFMYRIHHKHPSDFWRFSIYGLRYLCKDFSHIIQSGGWGNRLSQILLTAFPRLAALQVPRTRPSFLRWLTTFSAPNFYHTVWIIAKK